MLLMSTPLKNHCYRFICKGLPDVTRSNQNLQPCLSNQKSSKSLCNISRTSGPQSKMKNQNPPFMTVKTFTYLSIISRINNPSAPGVWHIDPVRVLRITVYWASLIFYCNRSRTTIWRLNIVGFWTVRKGSKNLPRKSGCGLVGKINPSSHS